MIHLLLHKGVESKTIFHWSQQRTDLLIEPVLTSCNVLSNTSVRDLLLNPRTHTRSEHLKSEYSGWALFLDSFQNTHTSAHHTHTHTPHNTHSNTHTQAHTPHNTHTHTQTHTLKHTLLT